jgi:ligand-binding sensor domain-containing protein
MIKPNYFRHIIAVIALLSLGFSDFDSRWNKISSGIREADVKRIFINLSEHEDFWVTTTKSVYQVNRLGAQYRFNALSPQVNANINDIFSDEGVVYLATNEGLYERGPQDYHFKRIFYSSDGLQRQCMAVTSINGKLFLGTRKGLFIRGKDDASWQAFGGELSNAAIRQIVSSDGAVYALNSRAIFRLDPTRNTSMEIFTLGLRQEAEVDEEVNEDAPSSTIEQELVDLKGIDPQTFYLATQKGVYVTRDSGQNWSILNNDGLPFSYLRRLLVIDGPDRKDHKLLAATAKGVYRYAQDRWQQVYQGLESNNISDLAQDSEGNIYAATDRGIFLFQSGGSTPNPNPINAVGQIQGQKLVFTDYSEIERYFVFEPTIHDVQAMAVEYAEVHPDKIKKWRKQAQMRALAPDLSTGINRSATEMFHWDSGPNPDNLLKGKDYLDWDVGLSWNLGDLIWNNDQTSIDSRSKLMVELREDVLDQVTRIYFERRRTQIDLLSTQGADVSQKIEQQMRLAELTAIIDGFTGGKFSRNILQQKKT